MGKKIIIPSTIKSLGQAIRFAREEQGITLRSLAEKAGVSAPFLSDVEHGRRQTEQIEPLAVALNVEVEELRKFDSRVSPELKEWLADNPKLLSLLKDIQSSGREFPLDVLKNALKK